MKKQINRKQKKQTIWSKRPRLFSQGNYGYVCTRVKAKRAFLFPSETYLKLIIMDIHGIIRFIGDAQYKKEINDISTQYEGVELVELALNKNLAELSHQILGFCKGDLYTMLCAYLQRWDIWNIKCVVRGIYYHASPDDIMKTIVPASSYPESYWRNLTTTYTDISELVKGFQQNPWYQEIEKFAGDYQNNLAVFENNLDIKYYDNLLNAIHTKTKANRLFMNFINDEIDMMNLKTLLLTKFENVEPQAIATMLISGGTLKEKFKQRLIQTTDFKQFLSELQKHPLYEAIKEDINSVEKQGTLSEVIRSLEKNQFERVEKFSYMYPVSILPILNYLLRKEMEVDNLRIIARGKEYGFSEDNIRMMLVV
jgi:V/A-type H+/Na+-transporting ATPase subunit C